MKAQPKARAVSHAHPPYATGFAVAGVQPPTCMIPEIEVFIGRVPIAPYETPGTIELGRKVAELVDEHNTVLMENHGVVSWSHSIEDAYFKMEIVEAYCRTVIVTTQLGVQPKQFSPKHLKDLLDIKQTLGVPDPRIGLKECELCDNDEWRPGVTCAVPASGGGSAKQAGDPEAESVVRAVTDEIMIRLKGRAVPLGQAPNEIARCQAGCLPGKPCRTRFVCHCRCQGSRHGVWCPCAGPPPLPFG